MSMRRGKRNATTLLLAIPHEHAQRQKKCYQKKIVFYHVVSAPYTERGPYSPVKLKASSIPKLNYQNLQTAMPNFSLFWFVA